MIPYHQHILVPKAKILKRKVTGFRDEHLYTCEVCATEFAEVPSYEAEVPK